MIEVELGVTVLSHAACLRAEVRLGLFDFIKATVVDRVDPPQSVVKNSRKETRHVGVRTLSFFLSGFCAQCFSIVACEACSEVLRFGCVGVQTLVVRFVLGH